MFKFLRFLFSHFGRGSRKSRKFGPCENFPLYGIHRPLWPNPTLAAKNSPLNPVTFESCYLWTLLHELLLQPHIWMRPCNHPNHPTTIPHLRIARDLRQEKSKAGSHWGLNPGLQDHLCRTLVSSPDPTLSRGKMVWWTKSNFLG